MKKLKDINYITGINNFQNKKCRDQSGDLVDWFVIYKFPKDTPIKDNGNPPKQESTDGFSYAYITSKTVGIGWQYTKMSLKEEGTLLYKTLAKGKDAPSNSIRSITYNDQINSISYSHRAHAKGTVWQHVGGYGFWIIFSVPNFIPTPSMEVTWKLPTTADTNGQTLFCTSFKDSSENYYQWVEIRKHLLYIDIHLAWPETGSKIPENGTQFLKTRNETLRQINKIPLNFNNNMFCLFSKHKADTGDIYEEAARQLNAIMYYSTWNSLTSMPITRNNDVCTMKMDAVFADSSNNNAQVQVEWDSICYTPQSLSQIGNCPSKKKRYRKDHSKWSVTSNLGNNNYVCFGDLNRVTDNEGNKYYHDRGGGLLCFQNDPLAKLFDKLVIEITRTEKIGGSDVVVCCPGVI